jgi:lipopolysaccharide export system permease protein
VGTQGKIIEVPKTLEAGMKLPVKHLDRYLLGEFLAPLALIVFGFAGLVLMVQVVDSLPSFRDWKAPLHLILAYHLFKFPLLVVQVVPVAVMLAVLVSLGGLARNGEIAAMHSGGVSVGRLSLPFLAAAAAIWMLEFAAAELLVPYATDQSRYVQKVLVEHRPGPWGISSREKLAMNLSADRQIYVNRFDAEKGEMEGVLLLERDGSAVQARVDAAMGRWEKGRWVFYQGVRRSFDQRGLETSVSPFQRLEVAIGQGPADFMVESGQREEDLLQLSMAQLSSIIRILRQTGGDTRRELVCLHTRVSYPFSCVVLALLGVSLPFLFPYGRRAVVGAAIGLLVSLTSGMVYLVFIRVGLSLGTSGLLPPVVAAWLGNTVFLGIGLLALRKAAR